VGIKKIISKRITGCLREKGKVFFSGRVHNLNPEVFFLRKTWKRSLEGKALRRNKQEREGDKGQ
jgi:hypothetical protein